VGTILWVTCLLAAISQAGTWGWRSPGVLLPIAAGVVGSIAWARYELRIPQPIIDLRQQCTPGLLASNVAGLLCGYAFIAAGIIIPLAIQSPSGTSSGLGNSATLSVLVQLPTGVALTLCTGLAGRLTKRWGPARALAVGCSVIGLSYLLLAAGFEHVWSIAVINTLRGAGLGIAYAAKTTLTLEPRRRRCREGGCHDG
jgi:predicted MFS family arabinose efflux permease